MAYQPSASDVHVNQPLTNIAIAFMQGAEDYVAHRVFPGVPVMKQADAYWEYPRGAFLRDQMEKRAPGAESAGADFEVTNGTYYADVWALHRDVADQIKVNTDRPMGAHRDAAVFLTQQAMIRRERAWVADFLKSSVWSFMAVGAATRSSSFDPSAAASDDLMYWNNEASTPIEDIALLQRTSQQRTGFRPKVLTIGRPVYDALRHHPDIVGRVDRGQTTGVATVTRQNLAALFELDEILVMDAIYNSANEGATDSFAFIGGKHGLLSYRPPSPGLMIPSAGYTFNWSGFIGAGSDGMRIKRFRMTPLSSDRVEIEMAWDQKLIAKDLGVFLNGIVQ